jgi:hypothetical protein
MLLFSVPVCSMNKNNLISCYRSQCNISDPPFHAFFTARTHPAVTLPVNVMLQFPCCSLLGAFNQHTVQCQQIPCSRVRLVKMTVAQLVK